MRLIRGLLFVSIIGSFCKAFNVNEDKYTIFHAPANQGEGSYFGYSTAFHNDGTVISVLVSATRGNYSHYNAISPGVLYKCDYQSPEKICKEIRVEKTDSKFAERTDPESLHTYKIDGTDHMWLGVSLDTQTKSPWDTIVCGHRWVSTNTTYNLKYKDQFPAMVGVCYRISGQNMGAKGAVTVTESQKLLPLYRYKSVNNGSIWAGAGLTGLSCRYSEEQDLYLGAPGLYYFNGGVISYKKRETENLSGSSVTIDLRFGTIANTYEFSDGYTGYALATGYFFKPDELLVALGAPKSGRVGGQVLIAKVENQLPLNEKKLNIVATIEGAQLGSYFGSSLLSFKLVDGELNLLVVGAPLYSSPFGGDEGRVYIYKSDGSASRMMLVQGPVLKGNQITKARFGSSIASVGDLNLDNFNDIAIGAPYENEHGTVYIYHGSKEGIVERHAQRIQGKKYNNLAIGFGINIANSMDIDSNGYPDLLIGAYASDTAFLMRSHPIVQLHATLNFSSNNINLERAKNCTIKGEVVVCFQVSVCVSAVGKHLPHSLNVSVRLEVDPPDKRGVIKERGIFSNNLKESTTKLALTSKAKRCLTENVYLFDHSKQDYINPVEFIAKPVLVDPIQTGRPEFCASCPIEDPDFQAVITGKIPFAMECGNDDVCECDLSIKAYSEMRLTMGENQSIEITVEVKNEGEPAYIAKVTMRVPPFVQAYPKKYCATRLATSSSKMGEESILECAVGNPFHSGILFEIPVNLDISNLPNTEKWLNIQVTVDSASKEISPDDCVTTLQIEFNHVASINITGYPHGYLAAFTGSEKFLPVDHKYIVTKYGPTTVNRVEIQIFIPVAERKGKKFVNIESVKILGSRIKGSCMASEYSFLKDDTDQFDKGTNTRGGELDLNPGSSDTPSGPLTPDTDEFTVDDKPIALGSHFQLDCESSICVKFTCVAGPFRNEGDEITIDIKAEMIMSVINATRGLTRNMTYVTYGEVEIKDNVQFDSRDIPYSQYEDDVKLTFLLNVAPPPTPPPKWIIAVSVGAGFLLLALIAVGLLRLGFFQRKKHEEMKRQLMQADVIKEEDAQKNLNETPVQNLQQDPTVFKI